MGNELDTGRLAELERIVEDGARKFVAVGEALREIRDRRLFRGTHESFSAYVEERFGFKSSWANKLIKREEPKREVADLDDGPDIDEVMEVEEPVPVEAEVVDPMHEAKVAFSAAFDAVIQARRAVLSLLKGPHSAWCQEQAIEAAMTNLVSELKWGAPGRSCPQSGRHDRKCRCKGLGWIPQSQIGQEGKGHGRGNRREG
jgi:hypothetical protein